jgi:hypothetical protein
VAAVAAMTRPLLLDLPHGARTVIDESDWSRVKDLTLYLGKNGYVYFSTWSDGRSKPRTLHQLLMSAPRGTHIDHINGDKTDNRRANLRIVSPQINQVNRKRLNRNNTSGVRGVSFRPRRSATRPWHAQISVAGKTLYLGLFESRELAIEARKAAEIRHFGELCP